MYLLTGWTYWSTVHVNEPAWSFWVAGASLTEVPLANGAHELDRGIGLWGTRLFLGPKLVPCSIVCTWYAHATRMSKGTSPWLFFEARLCVEVFPTWKPQYLCSCIIIILYMYIIYILISNHAYGRTCMVCRSVRVVYGKGLCISMNCMCMCSVAVAVLYLCYLQVIAVVLALASNSFGECLGNNEARVNDIGDWTQLLSLVYSIA